MEKTNMNTPATASSNQILNKFEPESNMPASILANQNDTTSWKKTNSWTNAASSSVPDSNMDPTKNNLFRPTFLRRLCPPHGKIGFWLTYLLCSVLGYLAMLSLFTKNAYPFSCPEAGQGSNTTGQDCDRSLYGTYVILVFSLLIGRLLDHINVPPLLGMLVVGVALNNIKGISVAKMVHKNWFGLLRTIALSIILLRAGLCLNLHTLKKLSGVVFRLAVMPCFVEATAVALISYFTLQFPISWGYMLGFVLGAVSPAIVVQSMLNLESEGYGVEKGIPTMVIAAASMDDVVAITGFSFAQHFAFRSHFGEQQSLEAYAWTICRGPLEAVGGVVYGVVLGAILWYLPSSSDTHGLMCRVVLLLFGAITVQIGTPLIGLHASGAIGCLTLAFVAGYGWSSTEMLKEKMAVLQAMALLWWLAEPLLFGMIGAGINLKHIQWDTTAIGLMTVLLGLLFRTAATFITVFRTNLDWKESAFVPIAWLPKATVQAAIGPSAYDFAIKQIPQNHIYIDRSETILTLAVLMILITAPVGAILIRLMGVRLLSRALPVESCNDTAPSAVTSPHMHVRKLHEYAHSPHSTMKSMMNLSSQSYEEIVRENPHLFNDNTSPLETMPEAISH